MKVEIRTFEGDWKGKSDGGNGIFQGNLVEFWEGDLGVLIKIGTFEMGSVQFGEILGGRGGMAFCSENT